MGFLDYEGLKYWYSKILTRFTNVNAKIQSLEDSTVRDTELTNKLAGYLPNTGGAVTGNLEIGSTAITASGIMHSLLHSKRVIRDVITVEGNYQKYDSTNGKSIITSTADGTNTFNGTATENLALDGGEVNGHVDLVSTEALARRLGLKNSKREIRIQISADGTFYAYDATNGKSVWSSDANFVNTFNGTATGNLALDGGTVHNDISQVPLTISNNRNSVLLGFTVSGERWGYFGFGAKNQPLYVNADGVSKHLLHTGNYADYAVPKAGGTVDGELLVRGLTVYGADGSEGGEINFASPTENTDFVGTINLDVWHDQVRLYAEHGGVTKVAAFDFSSMEEGENRILHTRNSNAIIFTEDDTTPPTDTTALWAHL